MATKFKKMRLVWTRQAQTSCPARTSRCLEGFRQSSVAPYVSFRKACEVDIDSPGISP